MRSQGADGYLHLPGLLKRCQAVALTQSELSKFEENLVGLGALSLGTIINSVGFNDADTLHTDILDWLILLTSSNHVQIAAYSIYAIGEVGIPPDAIRHRLEELTRSSRRADDHDVITCRAIAFRCLAANNQDFARPFVDLPACAEFLAAVDFWLTEHQDNTNLRDELINEARWLRQQ